MKKLLFILFFKSLFVFAQTLSLAEQNHSISLEMGWNMIGFTCIEPMNVATALVPIEANVLIVKDNVGNVYLPEFGFNGIESFKFGFGYQLKINEPIAEFEICPFISASTEGCTDSTSFNFDPNAILDDGSCEPTILGCTNSNYQEYNNVANTDDNSCEDLINTSIEIVQSTKYLAYVTFTAAEAINTITMVDPNGDGRFETAAVTTSSTIGGNGEKFAEFTFANESSAPVSITALAANMITNEYKITSLNGGGDNRQYILSNITMSSPNNDANFTGNIWTAFENNKVKIDLTKSNIDYVRKGFPTREAHAYIIFTF
jgi:hypothetical protein